MPHLPVMKSGRKGNLLWLQTCRLLIIRRATPWGPEGDHRVCLKKNEAMEGQEERCPLVPEGESLSFAGQQQERALKAADLLSPSCL